MYQLAAAVEQNTPLKMSGLEQPAIISHNPIGYWEVRLVWTGSSGA